MGLFRKSKNKADERSAEVRRQYTDVLNQLCNVRAELAGLREERDNTREVNSLKREITDLTIRKDKLEEDNARELREAEHKAGLLLTASEQDVANAKRETTIEVREENLKADRARFDEHMRFRDEHFQREIARFQELAQGLMDRLPVIEVSLEGGASTAARTPARPKAAAAAAKEA